MATKPVIGVLLGDAAGVGPELVAKCAAANFYEEYCRPVIIGDLRVFERALKVIGAEDKVKVQVISDVDEADWSKGLPVLDQKNGSGESSVCNQDGRERKSLPGYAETWRRTVAGRKNRRICIWTAE